MTRASAGRLMMGGSAEIPGGSPPGPIPTGQRGPRACQAPTHHEIAMNLRFNIKSFMLVVVFWALPNALFVWMVRARPAAFPKDQAAQFFIGLNIFLTVIALLGLYMEALHRYAKRGTTTAQMREKGKENLARNRPLINLIHALMLLTIVAGYQKRFFWSLGLHFGHLAVLLLVAPVSMMAYLEIRRRPNRRDWTPASLALLTSRAMILAWLIGTGFLFLFQRPDLGMWGFGPSFPIPPAFLLMMLGMNVFAGITVVLTRIVEEQDQRRSVAVSTVVEG